MNSNEMNAVYKLVCYLRLNKVQVIPLAPGKKYPTFKNWDTYELNSLDTLKSMIRAGFGFGIKPNGLCAYVDLDTDHAAGVNGVATYSEIIPKGKRQSTLYATKIGGDSLHLFYRNNLSTTARRTGNDEIAPGVEFSARDSQVRIFPGYQFANLDYTRGFLEQLAPIPYELEPALAPIIPPQVQKTSKQQRGNIAAYLKHVEPFEPGGRSSGFRKLTFLLVMKHGLDYDKVKQALDAWDMENGAFQLAEPDQYAHATRNPER